jgi:hypothetical protein
MIAGEVPESLLAPHRPELDAGEDLPPRELIAIARAMQRIRSRERDPTTADERQVFQLVDSFARWAFDLCDSTTDDQAGALFSREGLSFAEMSEEQQARFLAEIRLWAVAEEAAQSPDLLALHVRALARDREGTLEGSVRIHASFRGKACGGTSISFRLPYPSARCASDSTTERTTEGV